MITLTLPLPPTANHIWKKGRNGMYLSDGYLKFKHQVSESVKSLQCSMLTGPIEIGMIVNYPDKRKRDIDNFTKATFDALKGHLFEDDSQIESYFVKKGPIVKNGSCTVIVRKVV